MALYKSYLNLGWPRSDIKFLNKSNRDIFFLLGQPSPFNLASLLGEKSLKDISRKNMTVKLSNSVMCTLLLGILFHLKLSSAAEAGVPERCQNTRLTSLGRQLFKVRATFGPCEARCGFGIIGFVNYKRYCVGGRTVSVIKIAFDKCKARCMRDVSREESGTMHVREAMNGEEDYVSSGGEDKPTMVDGGCYLCPVPTVGLHSTGYPRFCPVARVRC